MKNFREVREDQTKTNRMGDDDMRLLTRILMSGEGNIKEIPESEFPFTLQIIKKRIEGAMLPIKFAPSAWCVSTIWATNPGKAVMFLIDCLRSMPDSDNYYKNWIRLKRPETFAEELKKLGLEETPADAMEPFLITAGHVCESVYPNGFWTDDTAMDYIDNYLKPNKVPWAELY